MAQRRTSRPMNLISSNVRHTKWNKGLHQCAQATGSWGEPLLPLHYKVHRVCLGFDGCLSEAQLVSRPQLIAKERWGVDNLVANFEAGLGSIAGDLVDCDDTVWFLGESQSEWLFYVYLNPLSGSGCAGPCNLPRSTTWCETRTTWNEIAKKGVWKFQLSFYEPQNLQSTYVKVLLLGKEWLKGWQIVPESLENMLENVPRIRWAIEMLKPSWLVTWLQNSRAHSAHNVP